MYKVIVVDDEPAIRLGLKTIIDWDALGFLVAGDASNGREAVARHRELSPDLIVIDIRMPGMDGLQAIQEIRKTDADCCFLILSGYSDFDYAKQAIEMGVNGYLLKPIDEAELEKELVRIKSTLDQVSGRGKWSGLQDDAMREELILKLIAADPAEVMELESALKPLASFVGKSIQILLVEAEHSSAARSGYLEAAKIRWLEAVKAEGLGYGFRTGPYVGFILKEDVVRPAARSEWTRLLQDVCEPKTGFTAAAGRVVYDLADIRQSYEGALGLLRNRFLLAGGQIHMEAETNLGECPKEPKGDDQPPNLEALALRLFYMLDLGRRENVAETLAETGKALIAFESSETAIKSGMAHVLAVALNKLAVLRQSVNIQDYAPLLADLNLHSHYDAMMGDIASRLAELAGRLGNDGILSVAKQVIDFIQRHYQENLKLETLAEMFNYNSGYLGKMFKQHTGDSFHTFLDKVRIQQAIQLLGKGLKVHQVSELVGYANVDYFHSKFKKYVGSSPSSFKGATIKMISDETP